MQKTIVVAPVRSKLASRRFAGRVLPLVVAVGLSPALAQTTSASGEITQADFTSLATKVLTYLGYAIAAGLTVLVATVAATAGWRFFSRFIK